MPLHSLDRKEGSLISTDVGELLKGKTALVAGVANRRSIAWAIARALSESGARILLTYQGERLEKGVRDLAGTLPNALVLPCDVSSDSDIDSLFGSIRQTGSTIDILVHSIAYASAPSLQGPYVDTTRQDFAQALEVSAYSLVALARQCAPIMESAGGGAILTMTYLGGRRVVPGYNVMGIAKAALEASVRYLAHDLGPKNIRVNAISAGPVRTLAARSIPGFPIMEEIAERNAPLRRNISAEEVGRVAAFLCSPLASAITGEVLYVDAGYHVMGIMAR